MSRSPVPHPIGRNRQISGVPYPSVQELNQCRQVSFLITAAASVLVCLAASFVQISMNTKDQGLAVHVLTLQFLPYLGGLLMLFTAITTYIVARLTWRRRYPYSLLCKAGGRAPASYIFMGGFCISGCIMVSSIFLTGNAIRSHPAASYAINIVSIAADVCGILSICFAVLMSLISVYEYESLHNWMAALFTGLGILYQWLIYGIARSINSPEWSQTSHKVRFACATLQTILCLAMFVCMQVEKTLNSAPGLAGAAALVSEEPYSPKRTDSSPDAGAFSKEDLNTLASGKITYAEVNLSLKIWSVLQYLNLLLCAIYFCTMGDFVVQYTVVLQA